MAKTIKLVQAKQGQEPGIIDAATVYPEGFVQLAGLPPSNNVLNVGQTDLERVGNEAVRRYDPRKDTANRGVQVDYGDQFNDWSKTLSEMELMEAIPEIAARLDAVAPVYSRFNMGEMSVSLMKNPKQAFLFTFSEARVPIPYHVTDEFRAWAEVNRPDVLTVPYQYMVYDKFVPLTYPDAVVVEYQETSINRGQAIPRALLHPNIQGDLRSRNDNLLREEEQRLNAALEGLADKLRKL